MNPIAEKIIIGVVTAIVVVAAAYVIYQENKPDKEELSSDSQDK